MAEFEETGRYCEHCERRVVARRKGTNHILHLILTLITFGFWSWIWLFCAIKIGGWRCSECGSGGTSSVLTAPRKA